MESSIAEIVERQLACELLPTENVFFFGLAGKKVFGSVNRKGQHQAGFSVLRILASSLDRFNKVRICAARTCSECLAKSTCKCSIRCIQCTCHLQTRCGNLHTGAYLLGLLAMIKCSICSYQCDN